MYCVATHPHPMGKAHPPTVRIRVLTLLREGHSTREVAEEHKLQRCVVQRWWRAYKKEGREGPKKRIGKKPTVTRKASRAAVRLLAGPIPHTTKQAARTLHDKKLTPKLLHRTTVAKHAKREARRLKTPIVLKRGLPGKALSVENKQERLLFCQEHSRTCFKRVLFTDRKRFLWRFPGTGVHKTRWVYKGQEYVAFRPNKPYSYNVYGGMCNFGVTKLHPVSGTTGMPITYKNKQGQDAKNITIPEYKDVVRLTLLPEGQRLFTSQGYSTWKLQQDNDPTHKAGSQQGLEAWRQKNGGTVSVLSNWPPNSPDLSPIENLWGIVQQRVDAIPCKTFAEFKTTVNKVWREVGKRELQRLVGSMSMRKQECVNAKGGRTRY